MPQMLIHPERRNLALSGLRFVKSGVMVLPQPE